MKLTQEMMEKARAAKTAEELLEIAKANGVEMTEDEAKTYFAQLNPKSGELDDDMLDGVAGGLVQLVNPSSENRQCFYDGTVCQHCGHNEGTPDVKGRPLTYNAYIICWKCGKHMVDRKVSSSEMYCKGGSRL